MTIEVFEQGLRRFIPSLTIRQRSHGDIAAVFIGDTYIMRLSKGEQHLFNWRVLNTPGIFQKSLQEKMDGALRQYNRGMKRRGRFQALQILVQMGHLNARQAQQVCWGRHETN